MHIHYIIYISCLKLTWLNSLNIALSVCLEACIKYDITGINDIHLTVIYHGF